MTIKVFTAFSGYDSQCMALDRLHEHNPHFNYELVGWAEIDKYAIQAHNAVYPQWADRNYGDISRIDWQQVPDFDLFTYSSPCQDFSQAGKQAGGTEGSGTRSSLLWECRRAILAKKPKYLLMENVAALVSQKFIRLFNAWQLELESYGYRNFAKVLNAKDYGVPQNRERIFMVSILDESARYEFPQPMPLTLRLKDKLDNVGRLIGVSESIWRKIEWRTNPDSMIHADVSGCIRAVDYKIPKMVWEWCDENEQMSAESEKIVASFLKMVKNGELKMPKILEGRRFKIRLQEPNESFRLMDVPEAYIDRIQQAGISRSQQYKMAGNSIVVSCMYHIWRRLWIDTHITTLTLF